MCTRVVEKMDKYIYLSIYNIWRIYTYTIESREASHLWPCRRLTFQLGTACALFYVSAPPPSLCARVPFYSFSYICHLITTRDCLPVGRPYTHARIGTSRTYKYDGPRRAHNLKCVYTYIYIYRYTSVLVPRLCTRINVNEKKSIGFRCTSTRRRHNNFKWIPFLLHHVFTGPLELAL